MRETSTDIKLRADLVSTDIITIKDPFRLLYRATNHWSPLVRYLSLARLDQHVPSSSSFAKESLLPVLFNLVDPDAGDGASGKFETRKAAEMLGGLLKHISVPEKEELSCGNRIIRAFGRTKDPKTKVALVVAADKLNSMTTDMTEFLANCRGDVFEKFQSEVGQLLITRGGKTSKGLGLMHLAIQGGKDVPDAQAFSLVPHKSVFWRHLQDSKDYREVSTSIAILECICHGEERTRLVEALYKRAIDQESLWGSIHQFCALGFIKTVANPLDKGRQIQLNHVLKRLFENPIEILHGEKSGHIAETCSRFSDFACPVIFELAINNRLSSENHGFVRAVFAASPIEALIAHKDAIDKVEREEREIRERISEYGKELNKATVDSLHKKREQIETLWKKVKSGVDGALEVLREVSPEYGNKYAKFLESVRGIDLPDRRSPIE